MSSIQSFEPVLNGFVDACRQIIGESNLIGVYLHGSSAMGCFNEKSSDLDLLVIVKAPLSRAVKKAFIAAVYELNKDAPPKGIEMSVVQREYLKPFVYPTPYDLHFSNDHRRRWESDPEGYIDLLHGTDRDLGAHCTITCHRGLALYGLPVHEVFGEVPKADYLDSIRYDIENAEADICENPVYIILNLCRVLAYVREDIVTSKKEGGEWGLSRLPDRHRPLVNAALQAYLTGEDICADVSLYPQFAREMLKWIYD